MAKDRERREQAAKAALINNGDGTTTTAKAAAAESKSSEQAAAAAVASTSTATGAKQSDAQTADDAQPQASKREEDRLASDEPPTPSRGRDPKGKRKVTFDVEPAVVTIEGAAEPDAEPAAVVDPVDHHESRGKVTFLQPECALDLTSS